MGWLRAGILGVRNHESLPRPVQIDPGQLTPKQCDAIGIRTLPSTFKAAAAHLLVCLTARWVTASCPLL
jgi:glutamine synthetase